MAHRSEPDTFSLQEPRRLGHASGRPCSAPRGDSLDDAPPRPLEPLDLKPRGRKELERLTQKMIPLETHEYRIEDGLSQTHDRQRTAHMVE
jgi:hypothetical protein